jgi:hypothetical protein
MVDSAESGPSHQKDRQLQPTDQVAHGPTAAHRNEQTAGPFDDDTRIAACQSFILPKNLFPIDVPSLRRSSGEGSEGSVESVGRDEIERILDSRRSHQSTGVTVFLRTSLQARLNRFHHTDRTTSLHESADQCGGDNGLADARIRPCHEQPLSYSHALSV